MLKIFWLIFSKIMKEFGFTLRECFVCCTVFIVSQKSLYGSPVTLEKQEGCWFHRAKSSPLLLAVPVSKELEMVCCDKVQKKWISRNAKTDFDCGELECQTLSVTQTPFPLQWECSASAFSVYQGSSLQWNMWHSSPMCCIFRSVQVGKTILTESAVGIFSFALLQKNVLRWRWRTGNSLQKAGEISRYQPWGISGILFFNCQTDKYRRWITMHYTPRGKMKQEMKWFVSNMEGQVARHNYVHRLCVCMCRSEKNWK